MLTLKLISTLSLLGSAAVFFFLLARRTMTAYVEGKVIFDLIRADEPPEDSQHSWLNLLGRSGIVFLPIVDRLATDNRFGVRERLLAWNGLLFRAGLRSAISPRQLMGGLFAIGLAGAAAGLLTALLFDAGLFGALSLGAPLGAVAGYFICVLAIRNTAAARVSLMEKRLPFAIEFMLLTLEANASFQTAMREYCAQMGDDPLASEFRAALREIHHGVTEQEALSQMGRRIESESLSAFILAVGASLETGQPVKEALKRQADAVRQRRFKSAEEIAKTASVRALFPLFIVMISVFLLLIAPMLIKIARGGLL
jgi:tight adherence protein C